MALTLFTHLCALLTKLHIPYQAFEDHSIRLLGPAPTYIVNLVHYLSTING